MKNRLNKYYNGGNMDAIENFGIEDLNKVLENSDGFMLAVSVLKDEKVTPFFLTKNYPKLDILKQLKKIREIATEQLEQED